MDTAHKTDRNAVADALNSIRSAEEHLILTKPEGFWNDEYQRHVERAREEIVMAAQFLGGEIVFKEAAE